MEHEHWHADVTANSYFIQGRSKCLTGDSAVEDGKSWLLSEIESDASLGETLLPNEEETDHFENYGKLSESCREYDGTTEAWEGNVTVPNPHRKGYSIIMGYRLMSIDGPCINTI
jgi:hypothetical protein